MLQELATSKGSWYNDMNFCEMTERVFSDSWNFLMGLKDCFLLGGHDPVNLEKIHELGNQRLSYFFF